MIFVVDVEMSISMGNPQEVTQITEQILSRRFPPRSHPKF